MNKKIFESKGDLGMFCITKKQGGITKKRVTVPQEFHFATDERIPPPANVAVLFDKLSLNSEPRIEQTIPRNTRPNPFHLYTEERGAEKERKLFTELLQKQIEEERFHQNQNQSIVQNQNLSNWRVCSGMRGRCRGNWKNDKDWRRKKQR